MVNSAYATNGSPMSGGVDLGFLLVMIILFAIFYFLLIRPQQKREKQRKEMLANLSHGDVVMTVGGIYGKIVALTDTVVTLEIADKVRIKVARNFIGEVLQKANKE
ncbi:MAG: preprotein translocase subunit YajC [Syntrophales bacterium]|nr:preprotein translocase subunit YajC [Syntrophales bacterium]